MAYDFGITEVSTKVAGEKVVLYDSTTVLAVYNLQPKLRAAANENDHFEQPSFFVPLIYQVTQSQIGITRFCVLIMTNTMSSSIESLRKIL